MIAPPAPPSDPVFVDRSGRRGRVATVAGVGLGAVMVTGLTALALGFVGGGSDGPPPLPADGPSARPTPVAATAPANA